MTQFDLDVEYSQNIASITVFFNYIYTPLYRRQVNGQ